MPTSHHGCCLSAWYRGATFMKFGRAAAIRCIRDSGIDDSVAGMTLERDIDTPRARRNATRTPLSGSYCCAVTLVGGIGRTIVPAVLKPGAIVHPGLPEAPN